MWSFLTVRVWAYICAALGVLFLLALTAYAFKAADLAATEADLDKVKTLLEAERNVSKQWRGASEVCDKATLALQEASNKRVADASKAVQDAQAIAAKYKPAFDKLEALRRLPTPAGAGCAQAIKELRKW